MKYLKLYNEYLKEYTVVKDKVGEYFRVKEDDNMKKILRLEESRKRANTYFLIAMASLALLLGFYYTLIHANLMSWVESAGITEGETYDFYANYGELVLVLAYMMLPLIVFMIYKFSISSTKRKIEAYNNYDYIEDEEVRKKYQDVCEKLYKISLIIICLNEDEYALRGLSDKKLEEKWKEIVNLRMESIDSKFHYVVTFDKYKDYLDEYILKREN